MQTLCRFAGGPELQKSMGKVWSKLLTPTEMKAALEGENFKSLKRAVAQDVLDSVKEVLSPELVQRALDKGGASKKSWEEVYSTLNEAFKASGLNIRQAVPCPNQTNEVLKVLNESFDKMGAFIVPNEEDEGEGAEGEEKIMDNVMMDVIKLLQTLVHLYDIKAEEVMSVLKICIKLDETVWAGDKKMERLTITIMNRALAGKDSCSPDQWFQVRPARLMPFEVYIMPCAATPAPSKVYRNPTVMITTFMNSVYIYHICGNIYQSLTSSI